MSRRRSASVCVGVAVLSMSCTADESPATDRVAPETAKGASAVDVDRDPRIALEQGRALAAKGEYGAAAARLATVFELSPDREVGLRLMECLIEVERHADAIDVARRLTSGAGVPPGKVEAQERRAAAKLEFLRARALKGLGRLPEAETSLRRSIELQPRNAASRGLLGNVLSLQGKHEEAVAQLEEALRGIRVLRLATGREQLHYQLARNLRALGRDDEAAEHFQAYRELRGESAELARLERAAANHPDSEEAHLRLGHALRRGGQLGRATRSFERARRLDPEGADSAAALAVLLILSDRVDEGTALARESLAREPTAPGYFALSLSCLKRDEHEEARKSLDHALQLLTPDEPFAEEIRALQARLDRS